MHCRNAFNQIKIDGQAVKYGMPEYIPTHYPVKEVLQALREINWGVEQEKRSVEQKVRQWTTCPSRLVHLVCKYLLAFSRENQRSEELVVEQSSHNVNPTLSPRSSHRESACISARSRTLIHLKGGVGVVVL